MLSVRLSQAKNDLLIAHVPYAGFAQVINTPFSTVQAVFAERMRVDAQTELVYADVARKCRDLMTAIHPLKFGEWSALKRLVKDGRTAEEVREWMAQMFGTQD